jgi:hypothetical protein
MRIGGCGVVFHLSAVKRQELQHGYSARAVVEAVVVGHNAHRHAPVECVEQGREQGKGFVALFGRRAAWCTCSSIGVDVSSALRKPGPG